MLGMAQLLARTGSYFPDLHGYPYLVANYPPLFIGVVATAQRAFGPSLAFPRLLGLAATLGIMVLLFVLTRRLLRDAFAAAAFAALFAMPWFVSTWAALARVDTTAILFTLAGLAVALQRGIGARAWPALVFFWLAFFTKQNALLAPAAVLIDLALARDRRLVRAALAYAVPLGVLFGLLVLATHGEAWRHLVPYTAAAAYEPGRMGESYLQFAVIAGPLLLVIAAAIVDAATRAGDAETRAGDAETRAGDAVPTPPASAAAAPELFAAGTGRVLLVYWLLNVASLSTIAKAGAAQNYFLEPWVATLLLAAFALRGPGERYARSPGERRAALAGDIVAAPGCARHGTTGRDGYRWRWAILLAAAAVANYSYPSLDRLPQPLRAPENARDFKALTRLVRETPGEVLSENLSLLVLNGRPVLLEPFGILLIAREGLFSTERLTADCERGRFPLVIAEHRMWEIPGFGSCLLTRYEPVGDYGPYQALRPR